jgi:hypothetical protein
MALKLDPVPSSSRRNELGPEMFGVTVAGVTLVSRCLGPIFVFGPSSCNAPYKGFGADLDFGPFSGFPFRLDPCVGITRLRPLWMARLALTHSA